ncbi:MAG: hypothetical protein LBO62_07150 [Endomicrobium sp.]|jgi:hypothetical protein|nr:hypothetical protein [Endomicrobium sp.]
MKKLIPKKLFAAILCFFSFYQYAYGKDAGETVFEFLKIPTTAAQAALASMTGFSSESGAHSHAMLDFSQGSSLSASYAVYFQDTSFNALNFILAKEKYVFNFAYAGFYYGEMERYGEDENGNYVYNGKFGANDLALSAGVSRAIFDDVSVGGGLKYVGQNIDGQTIYGFAVSLSAVYLPDAEWYAVGGIENLGPPVEGYSMPANVYAGMYSFYGKLNVLCGAEIKYFIDGSVFIKAAGEFDLGEKFFLRAGYSFALTTSTEELGDWNERDLSLGFGFCNKFFAIDYAWLPFGVLGGVNMLTLTVNF